MRRYVIQWLPEVGLACLLLFFSLRELGTFPAAWSDEGLFIMVAKTLASGHGYALPLLENTWAYPYFLAVGPTLIGPSALSLWLFGDSIAAARVPMILYLLATTWVFYLFTKNIGGRAAARWSTLLLITLSAFINTGKTVIGEVPGFFFTILGLYCLTYPRKDVRMAVLTGFCFGMAIVTKLTYGIIVMTLGFPWIVLIAQRERKRAMLLLITAVTSVAVYAPWRIIEMLHTPDGSLMEEIGKFVLGGGDTLFLHALRTQPELLLRLPYLAFSVFLAAGLLGIATVRRRLGEEGTLTIAGAILLFVLYFLNSYGWYRHLVPAHLLLLPFVPMGFLTLLRKRAATAVMVVIAACQGAWQLDHRGSSRSTAGAAAAAYVQEHYVSRPLLISQMEVFAQLPAHSRWLFLMPQNFSPSFPSKWQTLSENQLCWPILKKMGEAERASYGERLERIAENYFIVHPKKDCASPETF